jgi:hypothetical protein
MKVFVILVLIYSLGCNLATNNKTIGIGKGEQYASADSIRCNDINLNTFKIGSYQKDIEHSIGAPDSSKNIIDAEDSPAWEYFALFYKNNELYFQEGRLFGFILRDAKFSFNGVFVGSNIEKIKNQYPASYNNESSKSYREMIMNCYDVCTIGNDKVISPDRVIIDYNQNNEITKIIVFFY